MTKVGDTLYTYDKWRHSNKYWHQDKITSETTKSWLCGTRKINKTTMLEGQGRYSPVQWYTKQGKAYSIWLWDNAHNVGQAVSVCRNVALLKQIADMVGCKVVE